MELRSKYAYRFKSTSSRVSKDAKFSKKRKLGLPLQSTTSLPRAKEMTWEEEISRASFTYSIDEGNKHLERAKDSNTKWRPIKRTDHWVFVEKEKSSYCVKYYWNGYVEHLLMWAQRKQDVITKWSSFSFYWKDEEGICFYRKDKEGICFSSKVKECLPYFYIQK